MFVDQLSPLLLVEHPRFTALVLGQFVAAIPVDVLHVGGVAGRPHVNRLPQADPPRRRHPTHRLDLVVGVVAELGSGVVVAIAQVDAIISSRARVLPHSLCTLSRCR